MEKPILTADLRPETWRTRVYHAILDPIDNFNSRHPQARRVQLSLVNTTMPHLYVYDIDGASRQRLENFGRAIAQKPRRLGILIHSHSMKGETVIVEMLKQMIGQATGDAEAMHHIAPAGIHHFDPEQNLLKAIQNNYLANLYGAEIVPLFTKPEKLKTKPRSRRLLQIHDIGMQRWTVHRLQELIDQGLLTLLTVAPEGERSPTGELQEAKYGVLKYREIDPDPLLLIVGIDPQPFWWAFKIGPLRLGYPGLGLNLRHRIKIRVGEAFDSRPDLSLDEIMIPLRDTLPSWRWGYYDPRVRREAAPTESMIS